MVYHNGSNRIIRCGALMFFSYDFKCVTDLGPQEVSHPLSAITQNSFSLSDIATTIDHVTE